MQVGLRWPLVARDVTSCFSRCTEPLPSRWKGKQFATAAPKKPAAAQEGLFGRQSHPKKDTYNDSTGGGYVKREPLARRKMAFGSKDASRRDEFTDHIQTERYRWQLRQEMKFVDKQIADAVVPPPAAWQGDTTGAYKSEEEVAAAMAAHEAAAAAVGATTTSTSALRGAKARLTAKAALRRGPPSSLEMDDDPYVSTMKSTFQGTHAPKSARLFEPPVNPGGVPPPKRLGPYSTTSSEMGRGVAGLAKKPTYGLKTAAKDFYDVGHVDA